MLPFNIVDVQMGLCLLRLNCKRCGGEGQGSGDGLAIPHKSSEKTTARSYMICKSSILNRLKTKELEHIKHMGNFEW